jgi:methionyl-tRNA formyltransferase
VSIIFFGTPEFAVSSLASLINSGEELRIVVTQTDKVKGRGHSLSATPVKIAAIEAGLNVLQPRRLTDESFLREISSPRPEYIVVVAYGKVLPKEVLDIPEGGCINVHASLLPKYRGAAPISRAIMNGDEKTGVTTMLMDEGLDTGPVLLRREVAIDKSDTAGSLSSKLAAVGSSLLIETLRALRMGSIKPIAQSGDASYAPPLNKRDGLIDWSRSAVEICDFIRAMQPWPGAYCFVNKERVILLESQAMSGNGRPGVIDRADRCLVIGTGQGLLSVIQVQPAGKKPMPAIAFVIGRKLSEGLTVT